MFRKTFILVFILVLGALAVFAQDNNDPFNNDAANACAEGGAMEGKCNIDFDGNGIVDDYEVAWAWACGWYMIRYDAGIFAEVPSWCQSLIPPVIVPVVGTEEPSYSGDLCYVLDGSYIIWNTGGDGVIGNGNDEMVGEMSPEEPMPYPKCEFAA